MPIKKSVTHQRKPLRRKKSGAPKTTKRQRHSLKINSKSSKSKKKRQQRRINRKQTGGEQTMKEHIQAMHSTTVPEDTSSGQDTPNYQIQKLICDSDVTCQNKISNFKNSLPN